MEVAQATVDPTAPVALSKLTVHYGPVRALEGVDVALPCGAVGLLGPNGAGKSTALKAILGFVRPTAGRVEVYGLDAARHRRAVRRRIGYLPERDTHLTGLTGFQAVAFAGELSGLPRREARLRAHEVLQYAGLGEARYRAMSGYSAGMRQRVKLAQALVHDPPLLFLDEPTNGLDPEGRQEMLHLIRELARHHGKDVILSTHILHDAESVVDWVAILHAGRLVGAGPIRQLLPSPRPTYRVGLTGPTEAVRAALARHGITGELDARGEGVLSLPEGSAEDRLFRAAAEAGARLWRLKPHEPTLEAAFFHALDVHP
ncbi:MAG: ABC transporter ATP-binding protein [Planctomycetes bacterium]|nr:ABC transporter ATP-binding protein [Planctomycetota bacterium]